MNRKNETLKIIANKPVCPGYNELVLNSPKLARVSCSGQFFLLSVPGVFLRRPFSIYSAGKNDIRFLYKIIGRGTENLSKMRPGESIRVFGPLGNGYDKRHAAGRTPFFVAGGTGVASLHFLAKELKKGYLFYGARTKQDLVCLDGFREAGVKLNIATEDGSAGRKGLVTDLLDQHLSAVDTDEIILYSCGPHAMMEAVARLCLKYHVKGFVSLEEMMACGVGNCQGCAVKIGDENRMVCKDGPVFDISEVNWK